MKNDKRQMIYDQCFQNSSYLTFRVGDGRSDHWSYVIQHFSSVIWERVFQMKNDKRQMIYDQCFQNSSYLTFRVGDGAVAGPAAGDGLAAIAGIAPPAPDAGCNDLINANNCTN